MHNRMRLCHSRICTEANTVHAQPNAVVSFPKSFIGLPAGRQEIYRRSSPTEKFRDLFSLTAFAGTQIRQERDAVGIASLADTKFRKNNIQQIFRIHFTYQFTQRINGDL